MTRCRLRTGLMLLAVLVLLGWRTASRRNTGDLIVYYEAGERLRQGLDLYTETESDQPEHPTGYIYLPPLATALMPASKLPFPWVRGGWFVLMALLALRTFAAGLWLLRRAGKPPRAAWAWPMLGLGILLCVRFVWNDLGHGQVNILIFWLTVEGMLAAERGRDGLGGVLLGIAVVLKVTPALVVAAYLLRGRWKVVAAAAPAGLVLLLLPGAVLGMEQNVDYVLRFAQEVTPWHAHHAATTHNNVGLSGSIGHWLIGVSSQFASPPEPMWLSLDRGAVRAGCTVLSLGVFVLTLGLAWRGWGPDAEPGEPPAPERARSLALLVAAIPLISPVTWKPHLALLILPSLLAGKLLLTPGRHRLPLVLSACCLVGSGRALVGKGAADAFAVGGGLALGLVLLFAGLALWRPTGSAPRDPETPSSPASATPAAAA